MVDRQADSEMKISFRKIIREWSLDYRLSKGKMESSIEQKERFSCNIATGKPAAQSSSTIEALKLTWLIKVF